MTNTILAQELQARGYSTTAHHLALADMVVGQKFKILPPRGRQRVTRVIRKDARGFYAIIGGTRYECVPMLDQMRERVIGFVVAWK